MGSRLRVERRGSHVVPSSSAATGEREDKLGFEGEKREGKRVRKESGGGSGWRVARGERRARGEGERTSGEVC